MSYELQASKRELQGTGASRRLRRTGQVPAVVYGNDQDAVAVTVDHNTAFYAVQEEAFHSTVINLSLDGKAEPVIVRDFQMHPFKPQVMHIDFQRVDMKAKTSIKVALHFLNADVSPAVKLHGGRIAQQCTSVEVSALPAKLPTHIDVDLSQIRGGQNVHLSDLKLPEGVELVSLARGENLAVAAATGKAPVEE